MSETLVNPDKREEAASAPAEAAARVNLLDFDAAGLKAWCESIGEKPFRARQLTRWVHRHLVCDLNEGQAPQACGNSSARSHSRKEVL